MSSSSPGERGGGGGGGWGEGGGVGQKDKSFSDVFLSPKNKKIYSGVAVQ